MLKWVFYHYSLSILTFSSWVCAGRTRKNAWQVSSAVWRNQQTNWSCPTRRTRTITSSSSASSSCRTTRSSKLRLRSRTRWRNLRKVCSERIVNLACIFCIGISQIPTEFFVLAISLCWYWVNYISILFKHPCGFRCRRQLHQDSIKPHATSCSWKQSASWVWYSVLYSLRKLFAVLINLIFFRVLIKLADGFERARVSANDPHQIVDIF